MTQLLLANFHEFSLLTTVQERVLSLLRRYPETRGSTKLLAEYYYKLFEGIDTNLAITDTPIESITRSRRYLAAELPELQACEEVVCHRVAMEGVFHQFYGDAHE